MDFFDTGREMTSPHTSGRLYGELSWEELRNMSTDLTEEERRAPHALYYGQPMAEVQAEHKKAMESKALAQHQCVMPGELGASLFGGSLGSPENGYGVLDNGVGYAAVRIDQNGITDEMIRKYREEFAHEGSLFYKTWFPGTHLIHYLDGAAEDFGWGFCNMKFSRDEFEFSHLGITKEDIPRLDPDCINLIGVNALATDIMHPEQGPDYMAMVCYTRLSAGGRELRIRYWNGLRFEAAGKVVLKVRHTRDVMEQRMNMMMSHCMREYCNELRLIKAFWNT